MKYSDLYEGQLIEVSGVVSIPDGATRTIHADPDGDFYIHYCAGLPVHGRLYLDRFIDINNAPLLNVEPANA